MRRKLSLFYRSLLEEKERRKKGRRKREQEEGEKTEIGRKDEDG